MTLKKAIIFDASTLISLGMNGFFREIEKLKNSFNGYFFITSYVKYEIIDRPINVKRFELEAMRMNKLLNQGILQMPFVIGIKDDLIQEKTRKLLDIANKIFRANGKEIHILDEAEVSCIVLSEILSEKGIKNVVAVDERTLRLLVEKPEELKNVLKKKLHTKIISNSSDYKFFKGFNLIRSSELVYILYKNQLIDLNGHSEKALDALLYAVKFKGCAISDDEIKEIKKIG